MRLDSRLAAAGLMAAVFLSGAVTGGVLSRTVLDDGPAAERRWDGDRRDRGGRGDRPPDHRRSDRPRDPRGIMSSRTVDYLSERLDLQAEQRDSLNAILERQRQSASAVFDDIGPRLRSVLDTTYSQVRSVLDPEQQAEFDAMITEDREILGRRYVPRDSTRQR